MPSLGIAPCSEGCDSARSTPSQSLAPVTDVIPADVNFHLLEIGLQAIQPSPCHAGPPQHRPRRLGAICGFLACCCPLSLLGPGQPSDPGTSLRVPPGFAGDATKRLVAHILRSTLARRRSNALVSGSSWAARAASMRS